MDDGPKVQLLGGEERKALAQVKAHLVTEDTDRPRSSAVLPRFPGQDMIEQVQVLLHARLRREPVTPAIQRATQRRPGKTAFLSEG